MSTGGGAYIFTSPRWVWEGLEGGGGADFINSNTAGFIFVKARRDRAAINNASQKKTRPIIM